MLRCRHTLIHKVKVKLKVISRYAYKIWYSYKFNAGFAMHSITM